LRILETIIEVAPCGGALHFPGAPGAIAYFCKNHNRKSTLCPGTCRVGTIELI